MEVLLRYCLIINTHIITQRALLFLPKKTELMYINSVRRSRLVIVGFVAVIITHSSTVVSCMMTEYIDGRSYLSRLSIGDVKLVEIAAIDPDSDRSFSLRP